MLTIELYCPASYDGISVHECRDHVGHIWCCPDMPQRDSSRAVHESGSVDHYGSGYGNGGHGPDSCMACAIQSVKAMTAKLIGISVANETACAKILSELNAVEAGNETFHECCANIANDIKKLEASNQAFENTYASILAKLKYLDEKHSQPNSSADNNQLDKAKENYLRNIISKGIENKRNKPKSKVEIIVSFWTKYLKTLKDDGVNFVENLGSLPTQYAEQLIASINYDEEFFNSPKATIAKTYAALKSGVVDALDLATNPKTAPVALARLTEGAAAAALLHKVGMFTGPSQAGDLLTSTAKKQAATTAKTSAEIVKETANSEAAKGVDHLRKFMSEPEWRAYQKNPAMGSRFLGQAVHKATNATLKDLYGLERFKYSTIGPDFYDNLTGQLVELTTPGAKAAHVAKYAERFLDLEIVTYELPKP